MTVSTVLEVRWDGVNWTNESAYLLGYNGRHGFSTEDPTFLDALVPERGVLTCWLNNYDRHLTPEFPTGGAGGGATLAEAGRAVRLTLSGQVVFWGYVHLLDVAGGEFGSQVVLLVAHDRVDELERMPVTVDYALSRDVTDALTAITGLTGSWTRDFSDIGDNLSNFGKFWKYPQTSCLDAIRDVCESVRGIFWISGNGTAVFRTRLDLQVVDETVVLAVTDDKRVLEPMHTGQDINTAITGVSIKLWPPDTSGSIVTLYKAHNSLAVRAGETRKFNLLFRDVVTGERIASLLVATLAVTTDYIVNGKADGTGVDYTAQVGGGITHSQLKKVDRLVYTVTNNLAVDVYYTHLQVRGIPLYSYDAVAFELENSSSPYPRNVRRFEMKMVNDDVFAHDFGEFVLSGFEEPLMRCYSVTLDGRDWAGPIDPYSVKIGDLVEVTDAQADLDAALHRVRARQFQHLPGDRDVLRLYFEAVERFNGLIVDDNVYGVLDDNWLVF